MTVVPVALDLTIAGLVAVGLAFVVYLVVGGTIAVREHRARRNAPPDSVRFRDGFGPARRGARPPSSRPSKPPKEPDTPWDVRVELVCVDDDAVDRVRGRAPVTATSGVGTLDGGRNVVSPALFEVGGDAYTVRIGLPVGFAPEPGRPVRVPIHFHAPELVLARLAVGTTFRLLAFHEVARGTVLEIRPLTPAAHAHMTMRLKKRYGDLYPQVRTIVREAAGERAADDRGAFERLTEGILPRLLDREMEGVRRVVAEEVGRVLGGDGASAAWRAAAERIHARALAHAQATAPYTGEA